MNEFLTQSQLAERLVQKTGIRLEIAKQFSTVFFTIVKKGLKDSESFSVYNFGTFKKTWIEATTGLNPSNGEKINIPAHWRIKFIPCSAVAKRLNRPYAHLKARELPEEDPTSSIPAAIVQPENDDLHDDEPVIDDEDLNEEEKTVTRKNIKLLAIGGAILLLLILLISLLLKSCTSKKSATDRKKTNKVEAPAQNDNLNDNFASETPVAKTEEPELSIESLMFSKFAVPDGSDYHTIAEEKYGNRHLWPVLFAANKELSYDPDFVAKYRSIKVPELPEGPARDKVISSAVLEAYNAYLLMCEKEPDSPKNKDRKRLATRVLVSGELLVPGFIAEYNNRILPEYSEHAQNIVLHQFN